MRILFCSSHYPSGGGNSRFIAALAENLATRHDVTVIAPSASLQALQEQLAGVRVIRAPVLFGGADPSKSVLAKALYLPMGVAAGKRLLETESFDIIHAHTLLPAGRVGDTLGRFANTPNVLSIDDGELVSTHGPAEPRAGLLQTWARRLARRADCLVCPTANSASRITEAFGDEINTDVIAPDTGAVDDAARRYEALFEEVVRRCQRDPVAHGNGAR
ncbi:MAG: glycosyltransferase family 4 protein [Pseudomonadota bacterium]